MVRIDTKRGRNALAVRREPYWHKLSKGRHLGLRKLLGGHAAWIARYRDHEGSQRYRALGAYSEKFDFDQAKDAAENWFRDIERGVGDRTDDGSPTTIASTCIAYVRSLLAEGRVATARDAHLRFRRTVYGGTADGEFDWPALRALEVEALGALPRESNSERRLPEPHVMASTALARILSSKLQSWQADLLAAALSKASVNRTLSALKAALNLAVRRRTVSALVAQEWADVKPLKGASRRRDLFLDITQRRALRDHTQGALRELIEAVMHTGCRASELTRARRSAFDARTKSLTVTGKTGTRTMPLSPAANELFTRLAQDKLPAAYLLMRDDGRPWAHSDWDELVREAASLAGLPAGVCLYTLRHSFVTQALLDAMSTLEVSKIAGTSLAMIEKHYGHLVYDTARERLAKVQMV